EGDKDRAWYTYVIQTDERELLRRWLARQGIETCVHYSTPLPLQPAFAHLGHGPGDFPNAERVSRRSLALPLYPALTDAQIDALADAVGCFFTAGAARAGMGVHAAR